MVREALVGPREPIQSIVPTPAFHRFTIRLLMVEMELFTEVVGVQLMPLLPEQEPEVQYELFGAQVDLSPQPIQETFKPWSSN